MEIHGTVYFETQRPPEVPAFVKNHGLLPQQELQQLLRKAKVRDNRSTTFRSSVMMLSVNIIRIYISNFICPIISSIKVVIC